VSELRAGWREVWTGTHGEARRYHVATKDDVAACRPNPHMIKGKTIPLDRLQDAKDVPAILRCQRNGCKQRWPR
jgi:hypothetical protein